MPIPWYEAVLAATGSDGPGTEPPAVWPSLDLSRAVRPVDHDQDQLGQRMHELGERIDGTEGKVRGIATYAAVVTGLLVVGGVVIYASTR